MPHITAEGGCATIFMEGVRVWVWELFVVCFEFRVASFELRVTSCGLGIKRQAGCLHHNQDASYYRFGFM